MGGAPAIRDVLGVDGGQSATRLRHARSADAVELEGVSHQEGDTLEAITSLILEGWQQLGCPPVERAMLGLTTIPAGMVERAGLGAMVADAIGASEVWLADDAVTAHAGALSMGWGVSVTCGTGVACLVLPEAVVDGAVPQLIGGHGFLLGDEGGAFWIGSAGLRAVLRARDGRGPATDLSRPAADRFGGLDDLGARVHGGDRPVDAIARFAPAVLAAADAGDAEAERIVEAAAAELVTLVRAAVTACGVDRRVPVALGGRLLADGGALRRRLEVALAADGTAADARTADGAPLDGAIHLGSSPDPARYAPLVTIWRAAT